jgi:SPP1 family phage portal protein
MLTEKEIRAFIDSDKASERKNRARVGQRYYDGKHDILDYKIYFVNSEGVLQEDTTKSNIKITHPFFTELVDQEVQYMLSGKDGFIKSDDPDLQERLDEYFNENEDFVAELYEAITDCIVKGFSYVYAYKTKDGKTAFQCADSMGVVEVREKETDDGCAYVIYWYIDRIGKDNKQITRIEVWDSQQTWYYVQEDNGKIVPDESREINPQPHALYKKPGDEQLYYEDYGFIPFFRLDNTRKQHSGLVPIKDLIDDYDLMSCGLSNNIQDTNEALYVIKGFDGNNMDELTMNLKAKKHVGVGPDGDVDIKTVDIPYLARQAKLDLDEKNIYRFGMGFNSAQLGDGNITNIVIKSRYDLLDMKCNKLEIHLKQFLRRMLKVVLKEINDENETDYQQKDVYFDFEREVMTNAADNAQMDLVDAQRRQTEINTILNLQTVIDDETRLQLICEQLDLDYNDLKDKAPKPEPENTEAEARLALGNITPEDIQGVKG